jgi:uncharacterized membrane protein SpoIIM required for sporulation/uncharacterized RDD family membrane protein YckC
MSPGASAAELVIESATGVEVHIRIAGPGARSLAYVIDWHIRVILGLAWYAVAAMLYNRAASLAPHTADAGWLVTAVAPAVAIYLLYHWVLELAMRGSTPGKRMTGIRIASRDGTAPGAGPLLIRNVFRLIDCLPLAYGVGLLAVLLTPECVRIGDLAAGTLLVYDRVDAPEARAAARDRALASALLGRSRLWHSAVARAEQLASGRAHGTDEALRLVEDYRLLARDLAIARRLIPVSRAREYLESAYARVHATVHRSRGRPLQALGRLLRDETPEIVAQLAPYIGWVTALFVISGTAGFTLVHAYPDLIALFASPDMIAAVERGELWTAGLLSIAPPALISAQVLTNNIAVSLFAFCAGFVFGLGTFYIVALNGLTLGAVFAFTAQHGLAGRLFAFVLPHGCVELSVMCLSGAAGAAVGEALIRPSLATRTQSFQFMALRAGKLLVPCVLLLALCGVIEGYVSPDPGVPFWMRAAIGGGYWLLMVAWLGGWLRGGRSARARLRGATAPPPSYVG